MTRKIISFVSIVLLGSVFAAAQTQSSDAAAMEQRMKDLEERIIQLEGQVRQLKAQGAATPAVGVTAEQAANAGAQPETKIPVSAGEAAPSPSFGGATNAGKALNPDISVIGDFLGAVGRNEIMPTRSLELHESEIGLQAIIDPYARGDFFVSFGEEGVNVEEGFITFTALPAGFVAKVGKMRAAFGKVNTLHNHVLPWIDRPLVTANLLGGEDGINDAGFSVTRILPAPKGLFLEGTAQVFRGDSDEVFKSSMRSDVSALGHLRAYRDLNESTNLDVGVSYARGHNDLGSAFLTNLYGLDATLRWKPLRRSIYHSFLSRSEFVWSRREQAPNTQRAFGFYTSGDYQFARRWFVGGRYDHSERARNAVQLDRGASAVLTYWPSEFSQLRAQYRFTRYAEGLDANEVLLQLQFSLGAHGAHPF